MSDCSDVLAIDLGGTKIAAAIVRDGRIVTRATVPTPAGEGPEAIVAALVSVSRDLLSRNAVGCVGVGTAGVVDADGVVTHATSALPGWAGTRLRHQVHDALRLPVVVLNDVHAHARGEAVGRAAGDLLVVVVGTGVGGAMVRRGEVVVGANGAAGHVGHLPSPEAAGLPCPCGRTGHVEALASGPAMVAALDRRGISVADGAELDALARSEGPGSELARSVQQHAARALGRVVGGLVNVLDPDLVVVGGSVSRSGPVWWDALRAGIALETMDCVTGVPVEAGADSGDAALVGASAHAIHILARAGEAPVERR